MKTLDKETSYLIEEYIEGNEIGCDLFIKNDAVFYACSTSKKTNTYGVPISHLILSTLNNDALLAFIMILKQVLNLKEGFYNLDIKQRDCKFYLLDISPRLGGNCIPEVISLGYGLNEYEYLTKWLFSKPIQKPAYQFQKNVGVYIIGSKEKGILKIKAENHPFKAFEIELFWNKKTGDTIEIFNQGSHHLGYFIFTANSDEALKKRLKQVENHEWFILEKTE